MWLMKTLLTSRYINQWGAGHPDQILSYEFHSFAICPRSSMKAYVTSAYWKWIPESYVSRSIEKP